MKWLSWRDAGLLGAAAFFWPTQVMAANLVAMPRPGRVALLAALVWLIGVLFVLGLTGIGIGRATATHITFVLVVLFMVGGRVVHELGPTRGFTAVALVAILATAVLTRLGDWVGTRAIIFGLAVALMIGPVVELAISWSKLGENTSVHNREQPAVLVAEPDIFVVVMDGYPGLHALRQESMGEPDQLVSNLEAAGFRVPPTVWASYPTTLLSVASLFEMDYPVVQPGGGTATDSGLSGMIGGDSYMVATMRHNGYRTVMVESGWSGGGCGSYYDECVPPTWFDTTTAIILNDTVLGSWFARNLGSPFTLSTEHAMNWLERHVGELSRSSRSHLVYAHLIAPHPPMFLDGSCQRQVTGRRSGPGFAAPGIPIELRREFFEEQMACLNRFMLDLAARIEPDDVIIFVGDHGSDSRRQFLVASDKWSPEAVTERMNVLLAVRMASECPLSDELVVPNVLREVLSCYSEKTLHTVEHRMYGRKMEILAFPEVSGR